MGKVRIPETQNNLTPEDRPTFTLTQPMIQKMLSGGKVEISEQGADTIYLTATSRDSVGEVAELLRELLVAEHGYELARAVRGRSGGAVTKQRVVDAGDRVRRARENASEFLAALPVYGGDGEKDVIEPPEASPSVTDEGSPGGTPEAVVIEGNVCEVKPTPGSTTQFAPFKMLSPDGSNNPSDHIPVPDFFLNGRVRITIEPIGEKQNDEASSLSRPGPVRTAEINPSDQSEGGTER